ncbi:HAD hydrolase family protein, partial [Streptococcus sp. DD10]|uniref:HAD hydrolase family protein n=1 Tax=Streptococcus sp. DD10 TaxID=1777878 RepID=UPI0012E781A8
MNIKLLATDMDGTFLDGKGQFDMERLKKLLLTLKDKGIYFAVASGRGLLSLTEMFAEVRHQVIFIAENGSVVEFHGEDLYEATMTPSFYQATFEKLAQCPFLDTNQLL